MASAGSDPRSDASRDAAADAPPDMSRGTPPDAGPEADAGPDTDTDSGAAATSADRAAAGDAGPTRPLFRNREFVALWGAQGVSLTVNTALQFVLLILIVERFDSSIAGSGLIVAMAAPPVAFGLISGIAIDRLDKRRVMFVTNLVRGGVTATLIVADGSLISIYAVAFVTATMGQFFLPATNSVMPAFVPRRQLLEANSVFQLTTVTAQLVGMILLAPLMLKLFGFDASYLVAAVLILLTLPMIMRLPRLPPEQAFAGETWRARARAVPEDLGAAWRIVRADRLTTLAMLQLSTGGMLLFMFALLVPRFVKDVLDLDADNSVFIFWPVGLGAILALRLLTTLGRRYSPTGIVTVGLFGLALSTAAMGGINFLVDFLQDTQPWGALGPDQIGGVSLLVVVTLIFAFPMGAAYALVNAPAQTVLHQRAPPEMRGRVFAAQLMIANAVSMLALLVIGGVSDAIGVEGAMFVVAGMTVVMALVSVYLRRLAAQDELRAGAVESPGG